MPCYLKLLLAFCLSLVLLSDRSHAVTYSFEASAFDIDPVLTAAGYSATTLSGMFSYDSAAPVSNPGPTVATYNTALTGFDAADQNGSNTASTTGGSIDILNNIGIPPTINDQFNIEMLGFSILQTPATFTTDAVGFALLSVNLNFIDTSETVFADTSLPASLTFGDFDRAILSFNFTDFATTGTFRAQFELTQLNQVPLPAGALSLLAALGLLGAHGLSRKA